MSDRLTVFLAGPITTLTASHVIDQLIELSGPGRKSPIVLAINSPGGSMVDGMAIIDTMRWISHPVWTHCFGQASSIAALILASGTVQGMRFAMPNSRINLHLPRVGDRARGISVSSQFREAAYWRQVVLSELSKITGKTQDEIEALLKSDLFLSPQEAKDLGLIDVVVPA